MIRRVHHQHNWINLIRMKIRKSRKSEGKFILKRKRKLEGKLISKQTKLCKINFKVCQCFSKCRSNTTSFASTVIQNNTFPLSRVRTMSVFEMSANKVSRKWWTKSLWLAIPRKLITNSSNSKTRSVSFTETSTNHRKTWLLPTTNISPLRILGIQSFFKLLQMLDNCTQHVRGFHSLKFLNSLWEGWRKLLLVNQSFF